MSFRYSTKDIHSDLVTQVEYQPTLDHKSTLILQIKEVSIYYKNNLIGTIPLIIIPAYRMDGIKQAIKDSYVDNHIPL